MKVFFQKLFSVDPGVSMLRVLVLLVVVNAVIILNYKVFFAAGPLTAQDTDLLKWMLGVPFGAKAGQSLAENVFGGGSNVPKV